ncbi:MAG: hypothetical protein Q8908_10105 [Bacteroidota bacterium]|nr:hypothetical protein [Bacteroidota bacterium]
MELVFRNHVTHLIKSVFCFFKLPEFIVSGFFQDAGIGAHIDEQQSFRPAALADDVSAGLLIPRIALTGIKKSAPFAKHVAGMIVYNLATIADVTPGFYFNSGTKWIAGLPRTNSRGDLQYWDGNNWQILSPGLPGLELQPNNLKHNVRMS